VKSVVVLIIVISCVTSVLADPNSVPTDPNSNSEVTTADPNSAPQAKLITKLKDRLKTKKGIPEPVDNIPAEKPKTQTLSPSEIKSISLVMFPAEDLPALKYRLLPRRKYLIEGDAAELYVKAVESLPESVELDELLEVPLDEFEIEKAETVLEDLQPVLELLDQAALCKDCLWHNAEDNTVSLEFLSGLKTLSKVIVLQSRTQIKQGQFTQALSSIRTGIAMARHISNTPKAVQGLAGVATASTILKQIEEFIQSQGAPSLFRSLQDLPQPLINVGEFINDKPKYKHVYKKMSDVPFSSRFVGPPGFEGDINNPEEPEPSYSHQHIRQLVTRLDRHVAAMQCLEGIRLYMTINDGQLPDNLTGITEIRLPKDPVTHKPFMYHRGDNKFILESPAMPKKKDNKKVIRYEITINQ